MNELKLPHYFECDGTRFRIIWQEDEGYDVEYRHEYSYYINDRTPIWFVAENDFKEIYELALAWIEAKYTTSMTIEEFIDKTKTK